MTQDSVFLFDDREQFHYGDFTQMVQDFIDVNTVKAIQTERKARKPIFKHIAAALVTGFMLLSASTGATSANTYLKQRANIWEHKDPDLKHSFAQARKFIGLTQEQASKVLDLSTSAVEKIEQGVYSGLSTHSREQLSNFIEWVQVLREVHRDRKFIVRSIINTRTEVLGKMTPIEYAISNPKTGIKDLIALERQING
jgi:DNA-binding XRE family transcriptional regulator